MLYHNFVVSILIHQYKNYIVVSFCICKDFVQHNPINAAFYHFEDSMRTSFILLQTVFSTLHKKKIKILVAFICYSAYRTYRKKGILRDMFVALQPQPSKMVASTYY